MISTDLLPQEEGPDWREAKMASELKENKYWRFAKNNLTAKAEPTLREHCLYSLENIWGAGTECVQNLSGSSVSWGEATALNQNQISIFNDLFLLSLLSSCHSPVHRGE